MNQVPRALVVNRSILVPVVIELTYQERCQNKGNNTKYFSGL